MSHFSVAVITTTGLDQDVEKLLAPFQENNMGDCPKQYLEFVELKGDEIDEEYDEVDALTGKYGYWENPNAKWDFYRVGGRASGILKLKTGGTANVAKINDLDLSMDKEAYNDAIRFWKVEVEGIPKKDDEDFFNMYGPSYYIDRFGTKENYATDRATFKTFAMLLPTGEWLEKGEMGWFGLDSSTAESNETYQKSFNGVLETMQDHYITIVDCHI